MGDGEGKIVFWNQAAQEIFGYTAAEIVGQSVAMLMSERFREAFSERVRRWRKTGRIEVPKTRVVRPGLRKDGSEFPAEISYADWEVGGKTFTTAVIRRY